MAGFRASLPPYRFAIRVWRKRTRVLSGRLVRKTTLFKLKSRHSIAQNRVRKSLKLPQIQKISLESFRKFPSFRTCWFEMSATRFVELRKT